MKDVKIFSINMKRSDNCISSNNLSEDVKAIVKDMKEYNHFEYLLVDVLRLLDNPKIKKLIRNDTDMSGDGKTASEWIKVIYN